MKKCIVFTTLAIYQTKFWIEVGLKFKEIGYNVAFISFDDCSSDIIERNRFDLLRVRGCRKKISTRAAVDFFNSLKIDNPSLLLSHERITFGIKSSQVLTSKFSEYFYLVSDFLDDLNQRYKLTVIQELGGFISVLATFEAAKAKGIDNYFIEPSFFKGRQFFLKNNLAAKKVEIGVANDDAISQARQSIKAVLQNKSVVIPDKDKHHYSTVLAKVLNFRNFLRLFEKLSYQFLFRKHFEFGYPIRHVTQHLKMLINSARNARYHSNIFLNEKFVYFPLHVPADVALTIRSPKYLDQLATVDNIARNLPLGYKLLLKEHPAQIGALDSGQIRCLLSRYDYVRLLDPKINNFDVLSKAAAVVSINSKSGAEALLFDCPVLVLGDAFYSNCPLVSQLTDMSEINTVFKNLLESKSDNSWQSVEKFFANVWQSTEAGELYNLEPDNVLIFTESIKKTMAKSDSKIDRF